MKRHILLKLPTASLAYLTLLQYVFACPFLRNKDADPNFLSTLASDSSQPDFHRRLQQRKLQLPQTKPQSKQVSINLSTSATPTVTNDPQQAATDRSASTMAQLTSSVGYVPPFCKKTNGATPAASTSNICSAYKTLSTSFQSLLPKGDDITLSHRPRSSSSFNFPRCW